MSNEPVSQPDQNAGRRKAQNAFQVAEARTQLVKSIVDAENAALVAKTAKLRALRIAKEEAERADALANPKPAAPQRPAKRVARPGANAGVRSPRAVRTLP